MIQLYSFFFIITDPKEKVTYTIIYLEIEGREHKVKLNHVKKSKEIRLCIHYPTKVSKRRHQGKENKHEKTLKLQ